LSVNEGNVPVHVVVAVKDHVNVNEDVNVAELALQTPVVRVDGRAN